MAASWLAALVLALQHVLVPAVTLAQPSMYGSDNKPIEKVVTLITEMKATVEKEAEEDEESNDKYVCWCQANEKQKVAAIKVGTQTVEELKSFIQEAAGTAAKLATEIKILESDIDEGEEAMASANTMREKESEAFMAEEADMKETIDLLAKAIPLLQKVQLLQQRGESVSDEDHEQALLQVRQLVKHMEGHPKYNNVLQRDLFDVLGSLDQVAKHEAKKRGSSLAAGALLSEVFLPKRDGPALLLEDVLFPTAPPTGLKLKGGAANAKSYNSRSGPILGMLAAMKDQFMRDLGDAQKSDFKALVNFHKLTAAKESEIAAATKQKEMKEGQLADLNSKVAESKENMDSTQEAIDSDSKFLSTVRRNCKAADVDYNARVKARNDEIKALGETLEILTQDSVRTLFSKTMNFLQVGTSAASRSRVQDRAAKRAIQRLMKVGRRNNNVELITMAVRVRLDAFTKVKAAMDHMTVQLKKQQKQDYDKREECKEEIDETEDDIREASETKEDLDDKHQDLVNQLSELKEATDELNKEVSQMQVELKKAGEARKAENLLYQASVSDQRATVKILNMALDKLKAYYANDMQTSFLEVGAPAPAPAISPAGPEPETQDYSKNALGGSVMQLIARIIRDAESEEAVLAVTEKNSQRAYAEFVQDTSASIETARKAIAERAKQIAVAKAEKSETAAALVAKNEELEKLSKLLQATHLSCDYLLKNYDARVKARGEELDAIGEAKAILSGANFGK